MNDLGVFGAIGSMAIIEAVLRMLMYIAVISISFKGIQALNVYINRNPK